MTTPTVRQALKASASGAAFGITVGAGTAANDLLLLLHGCDGGTAAAMGAPTPGTWLQVALGDLGSGNSHIKAWIAVPPSAGAQVITCPQQGAFDHGAHLYVIQDADLGNPTDGTANASGAASASHVAPSVAPATADALLIAAVITEVFSFGNYTAVSGGMTDLMEEDLTPASTFATIGSARQALASAGATGGRTFTYSQTKAFASITVAIRGVTTGGPPATPAHHSVDAAGGAVLLPESFGAVQAAEGASIPSGAAS